MTDVCVGVADGAPSPHQQRADDLPFVCAADVGGRNPPSVPWLNTLQRCNMAPQEVCHPDKGEVGSHSPLPPFPHIWSEGSGLVLCCLHSCSILFCQVSLSASHYVKVVKLLDVSHGVLGRHPTA